MIRNNIYNLNKLSREIHEGNKLRGFNEANENLGQNLMLIVSELAEALEADRKGRYADFRTFLACTKANDILKEDMDEYLRSEFEKNIKDTLEDEIADAMIRLFSLCGALKINIEKHIELKLQYNSGREFKHGKKY